MENLQYSKILKQSWEIVALITAIVVVLVLIVCLLQPFQYSAETKILIIQKQEGNLDAYTATKSAERIAKNLVNIVYTSAFYNEVKKANSTITDKFSLDANERKQEWEKNVKVDVTPETGILELHVYDVDRTFASKLVQTIAYVLVDKGAEYHGGGSDVEIKVVDEVFISKYPVRPNLVVNAGLSLIIGFILGISFVILKEAKKIRVASHSSHYENHNYSENQSHNDNMQYSVADAPNAQDAQARTVTIKTMYDHLSNI
jgi:capsular polysaccharide biosynthesis protein